MTEYQAVLNAPRVPALLDNLKSFGTARGLPAWTYMSERLNRLEHQRVILRTWQFACHINEIASPGSYVTLELMRDSFIVMRGHDGAIRAFRNVCRHRGARLLDGAGACKGSIVCPYHGWTYSLDGSLRATPAKRTFPDLDLTAHGLGEVSVDVFRGLVFVRAEGTGPGVAEMFGELAGHFADWPIETYVRSGGSSGTWNCNWKTAVDNNLENYHIPIGHPGYDRLLKTGEHDSMNAHGVAMTVARHRAEPSPQPSERMYQALAPTTLADLAPDQRSTWVFSTMQPNIGINIYPESMDVLQMLPSTAETTLIRWIVYRRPIETREERLLRYLNYRINRQVMREDHELCERVQQGLGTRGYQPGPLSTLEVAVLDFHERIRASIPETRLADEPAAFAD